MSPSLRRSTLIASIVIFLFSGCAALGKPAPTVIPIPTIDTIVTHTHTPTVVPTLTALPTYELRPSSTPFPTKTKAPSCDADQTLKKLKSQIVFDESVLLQYKLFGISYLVAWFVDPEINQAATEGQLAENNELAMHHALILGQELNASDACVSRLFEKISIIVVDKNYNGWFSGEIGPTNLPSTIQLEEEQLDELSSMFEVGYLRNSAPEIMGSAPSGRCDWITAKENIHNHFSSKRENVGFYLVNDETGVNVWTQWDSPPGMLMLNLPTSALNIALELDCLFPEPERIVFVIVDETGDVQIIGAWDWESAKNQDLNQIKILYQ